MYSVEERRRAGWQLLEGLQLLHGLLAGSAADNRIIGAVVKSPL